MDKNIKTDNPQKSIFNSELYHVTYTKIITVESHMQKHQIDILLTDPDVKSINIKK